MGSTLDAASSTNVGKRRYNIMKITSISTECAWENKTMAPTMDTVIILP